MRTSMASLAIATLMLLCFIVGRESKPPPRPERCRVERVAPFRGMGEAMAAVYIRYESGGGDFVYLPLECETTFVIKPRPR